MFIKNGIDEIESILIDNTRFEKPDSFLSRALKRSNLQAEH